MGKIADRVKRDGIWKDRTDDQVAGDTPHINIWMSRMSEAIAAAGPHGPGPDVIVPLLAAWETSTWRSDPSGRCRRVRLTPEQRARVRELARRAVVAAGGRIETINGLIVVANESLIQVQLY